MIIYEPFLVITSVSCVNIWTWHIVYFIIDSSVQRYLVHRHWNSDDLVMENML